MCVYGRKVMTWEYICDNIIVIMYREKKRKNLYATNKKIRKETNTKEKI